MEFLRSLGSTSLKVSALGLGTVKFGRNQQVKYPSAFSLPNDNAIRRLLHEAKELGINLIDTAPAYGNSEARIGTVLTQRQDWILCTKVGEEFIDGHSHFDFSSLHTAMSIERSLKRLHTDYLDLVLIHSDGDDNAILEQGDCLETLREFQSKGLIRAIGMSTKTIAGGIAAVEQLDVVMLTYNLEQRDEAVVQAATMKGKGILVKKGLMSGHVHRKNDLETPVDLVSESMRLSYSQPGISSMIVGTINPEHLRSNVAKAKQVLAAL